MKIKPGFELREVCGEYVILSSGLDNIDFSKLISLNETAAFLWKVAESGEFDEEKLVDALLDEYEVDRATAVDDVRQILGTWKEIGLV